MTSKLIDKNGTYHCSNCMMRQPRPRANCWWCGNLFSNYEEILIQDANNRIKHLVSKGLTDEEWEEMKNENNFYRGN